MDLLFKSNLTLTKRQIKYVFQTIREEELPKYKDFLSQIAGIKINLEENISQLRNLPFFFGGEKKVNFFKQNKTEEYIIFSVKKNQNPNV